MKNIIKKYPLKSYYLFALIFSGFCWTFSQLIAAAGGYQIYSVDSLNLLFSKGFEDAIHVSAYIVFSLAVYGPLLASLAVAGVCNGKDGIKEIFFKKNSKQFSKKWYIILLLPALINLVAIMIAFAFNNKFEFVSIYPLIWLLPFFCYQIITSGMEEPGWRGFLLPELIKKYGVDKASWMSGLLWAIWHLPFVIPMYWSLGIFMEITTIVGFIAAIIAQGYIFAWLYQNTRSTIIAILFHASLNTFSLFIIGATKDPTVAVLPVLLTWVMVFIISKISDKETFVLKSKKI